MDTGKGLHLKMRKLLQLTWPTQRKFSEAIGLSHTTVSEYFSHGSNITLRNFLKILSGFGISLETLLDSEIKKALGDAKPARSQDNDDLSLLINSLEGSRRRILMRRIITESKYTGKLSEDVIERIEKRHLVN